ncbi:SGNH/GDSL hydrolase family protein [Labilibaculum euxinus]|uniref:Acylhydrolase n=1 Tax=Labilibaculum euxinus TaxID=2686357 RepID=A0A7M4D4J1_9BACT|nr:SGNH/GDSL hydrolase family protein [Labilibaculum euxinus]MUP37570.1 acylhydrolase [Labilibaculum euxinus]MVB06775.1 acylhydrolase [Labilibaculum euxinus]
MKTLLCILSLTLLWGVSVQAQDWPNLGRFKEADQKLMEQRNDPERVVFMGNSITEGWIKTDPDFFTGHFVNRGISGQTTPQMLIRFRSDVIDLKPAAVVILAGTNDIAGNKGPSTLKMIMDNLKSMTEIAKSNNIKVLLCSVLPAYDYPWRPGKEPNIKIPELNKMIKEYAKEVNVAYVDYFSAMVNDKNGMREELTKDGVHPTGGGYKVMQPIIEIAIKRTLSE